jgi:hypothetical protein
MKNLTFRMNKTSCAMVAGLIAASGVSANAQLALQLKASNYNASTGVWTDTSGNSDNATASILSAVSLASGVTPNGSSAVDIAGANGTFFSLANSISGSSGYTVFAVVEPTGASGARQAITGGSAPYALEYDVYNGTQDFLQEYKLDVAHGTTTVPSSSFSLLSVAVNSSGSTFGFNSGSDGTGAGAAFSQPITKIGNNEGGGDFFSGDIAEIDIYTGVLTSSQISSIDSTLTAEYFTAVPEPSTWAMMAGGFGILLATRRFRR